MKLRAETSGQRLDIFLAAAVPELTRSAAQRLLEQGNAPLKKNARTEAGAEYELSLPELRETELVAQDIPLDVVYEDADVLVVNKPKGLVVHPAAGHEDGTLVNALLHHCGESLSGINGVLRPGIVHRIDMDTTGALVICKSDFAHQSLAEQLSVHSITRKYRAIVHGNLKEDEGTIEGPIGRHPTDRKKMAINHKNGKDAITHYKVLERFGEATYVECRLETGRTHQIRVHMKHIGHTLFNDERYGGHEILKGTTFTKYRQFVQNCFAICPRQALHAKTLGFIHPTTKKEMFFDSELPDDMRQLIDKWRIYANSKE